MARWWVASTSMCTVNLFSFNSFSNSLTLGFVKMSISPLDIKSFAMRLISKEIGRFYCSDSRNKPAHFAMYERAAENKMLGSFSFKVVPKSWYMPLCLLSVFLQRKRMLMSLFSSRV
jgi:hypothetical protein